MSVAPLHLIEDRSREAVARRIAALQQVAGFEDQDDFARYLGVSPKRYNNWLRCVSPPSLDAAFLIINKYPVSLDWIYRGLRSGVDGEFLAKLNSALSKTSI